MTELDLQSNPGEVLVVSEWRAHDEAEIDLKPHHVEAMAVRVQRLQGSHAIDVQLHHVATLVAWLLGLLVWSVTEMLPYHGQRLATLGVVRKSDREDPLLLVNDHLPECCTP